MILQRFFSKKIKGEVPAPLLKKVALKKNYSFQYENFIISTQHHLFLLMEKSGGNVHGLKFEFGIFKYGKPNDEARGGHSLAKFGLGFYGMFHVNNSPWIRELMIANTVHPKHCDAMFVSDNHYVVCFKDVTVEIICKSYEEVTLSDAELSSIIQQELAYLE